MKRNPFYFSLIVRLVFLGGCLALGLLTNATALSQQKEKGLMPVAPEILFKSLPKKVKGWKLKRSKGRLNIGMWMESEVLREFERDSQDAGGKQEKTATTKFTIKDTAKVKGGELDLFDNFTPGKTPGENYEYLYLGGIPTIVTDYKSKGIEVQFLIKKRFLLTVSLRGQPSRDLASWFKLVNLGILETIPDGPKVSLPEEFTAIEIDELDQSRSSRYNSSAALAESPEEESEASISDQNTRP